MTVTPTFSVHCDGTLAINPGCHGHIAGEPSPSKALAAAKRGGWQRKKRVRHYLDFCPSCWLTGSHSGGSERDA